MPGSIEIPGTDRRFPALLREVDPPPPALSCLGDPALLAGPAISIVGSRAATRNGLRMAETLGAALAAEGFVVVSGLARGIDAAAHSGALSVGGGTVAVLAGGLDVAVPHATRPLGRRIAREGCLVTEYAPGEPPFKVRFRERNRIVAGLSSLTVLVEADERSGALITGRLATDAGREVMAVPGHPLAANSAGVNRFLRDGAGVVRSPRDVLEVAVKLPGVADALAARRAALAGTEPAAGPSGAAPGPTPSPDVRRSGALRAVLGAVEMAAEPAETIAERAGVDLVTALAALTRLEIHGLVRSVSGRRYELAESEEP